MWQIIRLMWKAVIQGLFNRLNVLKNQWQQEIICMLNQNEPITRFTHSNGVVKRIIGKGK